MPESKNNFVVYGLSGTFPGIGTYHLRGGKTFLRKISAKSSVPDSKEQIAVKERFAACSRYAKAAIKDPVLKAAYRAVAKPGKTAYNMAVADAYYPPNIGKFDTDGYQGRTGDFFTVEAWDNFRVAAVKIAIHNSAGQLIEQGDAVMQINQLDWRYVATANNESCKGSTITATAMDLPGNKACLALVL